MDSNKRAVAGIVNGDDLVLIVKKKKGPGFMSEKWHIPGETAEGDESDETALIRGIKEEAGIEVKVGKYIGCHRSPKHTLIRWYECVPVTYDLCPGSDAEDAKWVPREDVSTECHPVAVSVWPKEIREYFGLNQ